MTCPRCGNEWDVTKSPCARCGLLVRLPGRLRSPARDQSSTANPSGPSGQPGTMSPGIQPTTMRPNPTPPSPAARMQRDTSGVLNTSDMINTSPSNPFAERTPSDVNPQRPNPFTERISGDIGPRARAQSFAERSSPDYPPLPRREQSHLDAMPSDINPWTGQRRLQSGVSSPDYPIIPKSVPSRPHIAADQALSDLPRQQPPLRPSRLVTEPPRVEGPRAKANQSQIVDKNQLQGMRGAMAPQSSQMALSPQSHVSQISQPLPSPIGMAMQAAQDPAKELRLLAPGTLLRSGRYRLRELKGRQEWQGGVYEATWVAQDAQRSGSEVTICELMTPESGSMMVQSFLRTATMALTSIGRHPRIPTLWDAFGDQGRNFFVFEPVEGESLQTQMRRTGRALPEQDVIECCLQLTEILELLSMQTPPLIHGLINPEHIIISRQTGDYVLTNFSVVLAGGATQFISGMDRSRLSPYMAPDFSRGNLDPRSDLYSLLASAHHAVTGSIPSALNGTDTIPQAQQLNPNVSLQFNAILAKGLLPNANQRYQRPSDLRQELLALRSRAQSYASPGSFSQRNSSLPKEPLMPYQPAQPVMPVASAQPSIFSASSPAKDDLAQILPDMLTSLDAGDIQEQRLLLPRPEELPPLQKGNDTVQATLWLAGILLCLILVILVSRGLI